MRRLMVTAGMALAMVGAALAGPADAAEPDVRRDDSTAAGLPGIPAALPLSHDSKVAAWQRLQFGLMLHWGIYSKLGGYYQGRQQGIGYPEQIKAWMDISDEDYLTVASEFTADKFDPAAICRAAKGAGMKYIVITSKHHDGFAMWDTRTTDYNVVAKTPFARDPLKELSAACRKEGLGFGVYFSIIDWTKQVPEPWGNMNPIEDSMMPFIHAQLKELMTGYGQIDEVWFDMGGPTAAQSAAMAATVHRYQPRAMVNSRVWNDKGDFEVGGDNSVPDQQYSIPWESIESIFPQCWGYCTWPSANRSDAAFDRNVRWHARSLLNMTANGGQYLFNVGPKGDGSIDAFDGRVLRAIGDWTRRNPGAVIGARPTRFPTPHWGKITAGDDSLYLSVTDMSALGTEIRIPRLASTVRSVTVAGSGVAVPHRWEGTDLVVTLPATATDPVIPVIRVRTAGAPQMVPEQTVVSDTGHWIIGADRLVAGRAPWWTTVSQSAYVASTATGAARVSITVQGRAADPDTLYQVSLAGRRVIVTGAQLTSRAVGGFSLPSGRISGLRIQRAASDYITQPLALDIDRITLSTR